ncbi:STY0301 family protein [Enterobacter sp. Bisph1]|uniref:STY0301 family protein n=1 Tax=Enterobacter sp. Bisph1 TaxID=1274399 RepID=UPI00057C1F34|nr:STY0301 family protein [Enterobacter sp. Bisph1]
MLWSKRALALSAIFWLYSGLSYAEKIECPQSLTENHKQYPLFNLDVFEGPPEEMGSLMPDSDEAAVWTLSDSQAAAKARNTAMFLVCQFKGTKKTVTLKIPASAKKCSAWIEGSAERTHITCE